MAKKEEEKKQEFKFPVKEKEVFLVPEKSKITVEKAEERFDLTFTIGESEAAKAKRAVDEITQRILNSQPKAK